MQDNVQDQLHKAQDYVQYLEPPAKLIIDIREKQVSVIVCAACILSRPRSSTLVNTRIILFVCLHAGHLGQAAQAHRGAARGRDTAHVSAEETGAQT